MPSNIDELAAVKVQYTTVPGWKKDITKISKYEELPANAKAYISTIEELLGVPVSWIGTGPAREAMIKK